MCGCYRTTSCWGGGTRVYLFIFFFLKKRTRVYVLTIVGVFLLDPRGKLGIAIYLFCKKKLGDVPVCLCHVVHAVCLDMEKI